MARCRCRPPAPHARRTGKTALAEIVGREYAGERFVKLDFQTDAARTGAIFSGSTDDLGGTALSISKYLRCDLPMPCRSAKW